MKTLTVKQAAQALGVSVRTVQHRLNTGDLKGKRTQNQYGVSEWRVWPNKEIMERLGKSLDEIDLALPASDEFEGGDSSSVIDAVAIENFSEKEDESSLRTVVRELTQQFAEQLSREKAAVAQLQRDLEDKDRQLKLLPDFQKQAEEERKAAELRALEVEALNKQIAAMQMERDAAEQIKQKVQQLEQTLAESQRQAQEEIERSKEAHAKAIEELRAVDEAKQKAALEEERLRSDKYMREEAERIKLEKESEVAAVKAEVERLAAEMAKLRKPWWKKVFGGDNDAKTT